MAVLSQSQLGAAFAFIIAGSLGRSEYQEIHAPTYGATRSQPMGFVARQSVPVQDPPAGDLHDSPAPEIQGLGFFGFNSLLARLKALEADLRRERNRLEKVQAAAVIESEVVVSIERTIAHLETEYTALTQTIEAHIQGHPQLAHDRALLESIKGVGPVLSAVMLGVLQPGKFDSAAKAAAYLGLSPVEHQSGSSVSKGSRLSKHGSGFVTCAEPVEVEANFTCLLSPLANASTSPAQVQS